jgi:hypothetical protein
VNLFICFAKTPFLISSRPLKEYQKMWLKGAFPIYLLFATFGEIKVTGRQKTIENF